MESSLSMGGAIILIALFDQNYVLEQQHNMSRSCDLVSFERSKQLTFFLSIYGNTKKALFWSEYARLYEKDPKEIQNNNIIETNVFHSSSELFKSLLVFSYG